MRERINDTYIKIGLFVGVLILIIGYYLVISQDVYSGERALYRDDLGTYQVIGDESKTFSQRILDTTANKTRYVFNFILIVFFKIVGTNFERIDTLLFIWNVLLSVIFFLLLWWLIDSKENKKDIFLSLGGTLAFSSSRFSYYTMSEVLGIMEGLALLLTVAFLILLIKDNYQFGQKYWIANVLCLVNMYVHERYFVLWGVVLAYIILAKMVNREKRISSKVLIAFSAIAIFFIQRYFVLGNRVLDGTSGTDIVDTFSIKTFITHVVYQMGYLLGVNAPNNAYLNGIAPTDVSCSIYILTIVIIFSWMLIFILFVHALRCKQLVFREEICKLTLGIAIIGALIVASSVTIRVEMRWLYASYAIFISLMTYMASRIIYGEYKKQKVGYALWVVAIFCILGQEQYYRDNWRNLYYWGDRELSSSLVENIDVNDKEIENITIVSADEGFSWDSQTVKDLLSPYEIECYEVVFVDNIFLIPENAEYILLKKTGENLFLLMTDVCSSLFNKAGWYEDGWVEPYATFSMINTDSNNMSMRFMYTGAYRKGMGGEVWVNGEKQKEFMFKEDDNWLNIELENIETGLLKFEIKFNFVVIENSGRSEEGKLSCLLYEVNW